jgi:hypothetical protein
MLTIADLARQVLDLSKATFDNTFLTASAIQHAVEDLALSAADSRFVAGELKVVTHECVGLARRTRRDVKNTSDRCYRAVHALVDRLLEPGAGDSEDDTASPREDAVVH